MQKQLADPPPIRSILVFIFLFIFLFIPAFVEEDGICQG
jgi:hypothetical protein